MSRIHWTTSQTISTNTHGEVHVGDAYPLPVDVRKGNISINPGDIQIGAVEIKDESTTDRVNVETDSTKNAMFVQSESLATEATLTSVDGTLTDIETDTTAIASTVASIDTTLDVDLSTRASETTLTNIATSSVSITNTLTDIEIDTTAIASGVALINDTLTDKSQYTRLTDGTSDVLVSNGNALRTHQDYLANTLPVWSRFTLITTSTTPAQVVGTFTPTSGRTLVIDNVILQGELSTPSGGNVILGEVSFQVTLNGSTFITLYSQVLRSGIRGKQVNQVDLNPTMSGIRITGDGTVAFRMIVTPFAAASRDWQFIMIGNTFLS